MKNSRKLLFATAASITLAGCETTQLSNRPFDPYQGIEDGSPQKFAGFPYAIPSLQYEVSTDRMIVKCEEGANGITALELAIKTAVEPEYAAGEWFLLDYEEMASWTKTSSLDVKLYPNQTIKSINAGIDDKSPEVLTGAIQSGFKIARLAAGLPSASANESGSPQCPKIKIDEAGKETPKIVTAHRTELIKGRDGDAAKLEKLTQKIEVLTLRTLRAGGNLSDDDKKKLQEYSTDIDNVTKAITESNKQIAKLEKGLTFKSKQLWSPDGSNQHNDFNFLICNWEDKCDEISSFEKKEITADQRERELNDVKKRLVWVNNLFGKGLFRDNKPADNVYKSLFRPLYNRLMFKGHVEAYFKRDATSRLAAKTAGNLGVSEAGQNTIPNSYRNKANNQKSDAVSGVVVRQPISATLLLCHPTTFERAQKKAMPEPRAENEVQPNNASDSDGNNAAENAAQRPAQADTGDRQSVETAGRETATREVQSTALRNFNSPRAGNVDNQGTPPQVPTSTNGPPSPPVQNREIPENPSETIKYCQTDASIIHSQRYMVPQLGPYIIFPLVNGFGENNILDASFNQDGTIATMKYESKKAAGVAVANLLNQTLDQGLSIDAALRTRNEERKTAEEAEEKKQKELLEAELGKPLKDIKNQIELLKKQNELATLQAQLDPENIAASEEQRRIQALIAQLEAEKTIKELRAFLEQ